MGKMHALNEAKAKQVRITAGFKNGWDILELAS